MYGTTETNGIIVMSGEYLLHRTQIIISMVELIGQNCKDLLDASGKMVDFNSTGKKIQTNAQKVAVSDVSQLKSLIQSGMVRRTTKTTNQNSTSSRTHAMTIIEISGSNHQLIFADLAGYENSDDKENLAETNMINTSLSSLNKVLLERMKQKTPSCSESNLTKFLRPVLLYGKTTLLYHIHNRNVSKYLNQIDTLMRARVLKKHA